MQADADDRKCADAFREYVVPVQMYSMLRDRSRKQVGPISLTRGSALSRNAASAHKHGSQLTSLGFFAAFRSAAQPVVHSCSFFAQQAMCQQQVRSLLDFPALNLCS